MSQPANPLSVTRITRLIKDLLESDDALQYATIAGEIGEYKQAASGHAYFSLKDDNAVLNCVMWRSSARRLDFRPEAGDAVVVQGGVEVYAPRGGYQLIASRMARQGVGRIYEEYERRKREFAARGWFADELKKPIARFPRRLGVVTSASGAALRDVLRTLQNRWPAVEVVLFPSLVQGKEAPDELAAALTQALRCHAAGKPIDTVLLVRGGGSMTDLWAFNDERIVSALHRCPLPVITGVGHEPDTTLVDYVADLRASTPTAAAEMAVPDRTEVRELVDAQVRRLTGRMDDLLQRQRTRLDSLQHRTGQRHPRRILEQRMQQLDYATEALQGRLRLRLDQSRAQLDRLQASLRALDPEAVLTRGFSIVRNREGRLVTHPEQTMPGDPLAVKARGGAYAVVRQASPPGGAV